MSQGGWVLYAAVFAGSALLALVLTPVAMRVAVRAGILDHPGERKRHESPVPYLGGVAIVTAFSCAVVGAAVVRPPQTGLPELVGVFWAALFLAFLGLLDDLRGLSLRLRAVVEIGAGVLVWALGAGVGLFPHEALNLAFTVMWVVGITNAFNLLDNMDGLSAGLAAIAAATFFVIAAVNGQFLVAALAAALAGCALGFLRRNFHPARVYMGDAGSLFLGFLLAYLGLKLRFDGPASVTFLVPPLVLGVAVLDTVLVVVSRVRAGRSPVQGGLDHTSHRLVAVGLPVPSAVTLVYAGAASLGVLGIVVSRADRLSGFLLAGLAAAVGLLLLGFLLKVPVYGPDDETLEAISAAEARAGAWRAEAVRLAVSPGAGHPSTFPGP